MSSIVSLAKQQIAVYKMAQKPTPQNKVLGIRLELSSRRRHIKPRSLPQTVIS